MKKKYTLIFLILILTTTQSFSQDSAQETGSLSGGTISSQFDYINRISNNFQEYKVVKRTNFDKLRSNVLDSLQVFKKELITLNQKLSEQQASIESLQTEINNVGTELKASQEARDSFTFLGMPIHKAAYSTIMWAIVATLSIAFLFFLFKYSQSHKVITKAKKDLGETVEEFEQHRKNTLDRERKLKRELVDALNGKSN